MAQTTTFDKLPNGQRIALLVNFSISVGQTNFKLRDLVHTEREITYAEIEADFEHCQNGEFEEFLEENGLNK